MKKIIAAALILIYLAFLSQVVLYFLGGCYVGAC